MLCALDATGEVGWHTCQRKIKPPPGLPVSCALLDAAGEVSEAVRVDYARRRGDAAPVQAHAHARARERQVVLLALRPARAADVSVATGAPMLLGQWQRQVAQSAQWTSARLQVHHALGVWASLGILLALRPACAADVSMATRVPQVAPNGPLWVAGAPAPPGSGTMP